MLKPHIHSNGFVGDGQRLCFKLAQHGDKVSPCGVFGNRYGAGFGRDVSTPANIKRGFGFGNVDFAIAPFERATCELRRLAAILFFEYRVFRATFKEILEGGLLVTQGLLERNTGNFIEPWKLPGFFDPGKFRIGFNIPNAKAVVVVSVCTPPQDMVVNKANTTERPRQQVFLLWRRVKTVFVCSLSHVLHYTRYYVRCKQFNEFLACNLFLER
jgi:hypothetical protein